MTGTPRLASSAADGGDERIELPDVERRCPLNGPQVPLRVLHIASNTHANRELSQPIPRARLLTNGAVSRPTRAATDIADEGALG